MSDDVAYVDAAELVRRFRAGEQSPVEVVEALEKRAAEIDPAYNTLWTTAFDEARVAAQASEQRYRDGTAGALDGVPVVVKDLADTAGLRTTYGSRMFASHVPARDASAVARLRAAGALVVAKSATHEFAWGITTDNEHFGPTRNPWAPALVPGGSSGGSAAALAAGLAPLALGTDTAGSVRIPAAFCGVVGLRPTHGAVPLDGVFPLAPSFDVVGPMARTVEDAAAMHAVLTGRPVALDAARRVERTVAVCPALDQVPPGPVWAAAVAHACESLAGAGVEVVTVDAPDVPLLFDTLATLVMGEGLHTHRAAGLWPERAEEYGRELHARLTTADALDPALYREAQARRPAVAAGAARLFAAADVLLSPASAVPPVPIGEDRVSHGGRELTFREAVMSSMAMQSLCGLPACVVRVDIDAAGLPTAVQVTGRPGADDAVLAVAASLYRATAAVQARWPC